MSLEFICEQWCSRGYTPVYGVYPLIFQSALRIPTSNPRCRPTGGNGRLAAAAGRPAALAASCGTATAPLSCFFLYLALQYTAVPWVAAMRSQALSCASLLTTYTCCVQVEMGEIH